MVPWPQLGDGVERTGIYGGVNELGFGHRRRRGRALHHAGIPVGVVDQGMVGGKLNPAAALFQREVVTASDPGALIDGVSVDVDDVFAADFGQWDLPR